MSVHTLTVNVTRGEVTPFVHARVDVELYQAAVATARNFIVTRYGGLTRAPGTLFMGHQKFADQKARFIPFKFDAEQVYALEAGNLYFRFWTAAGRIESPPGTPVEVASPYLEADLKYLRVRQSGDVLYIWCRGYRVRVLTRLSETSWTLESYDTEDGPYMPIDPKGTTLTLNATNHITPISGAGGTVTQSGGVGTNLLDRNLATDAQLSAGSTGWLQYQHPGGQQRVPNAYWIASAGNSFSQDMVTGWKLSGSNDGVTFTVLDSRQNETGWGQNEIRYFEFENESAFEYLRVEFIGGGGDDATPTVLAEVAIAEHGDYMTPLTLTASSGNGINNNAGFNAGDVDRPIRLLGGDGRWRWAKIVSFVSATQVLVRVYGQALPDTRPISTWRLGAFSASSGWPASGAIYEDRLIHARTPTDPLSVWASVSSDYDNFRTSTPLQDDDSISLRLTGGELNDIRWLMESRDIVAGTAGNIRAVGRANENAAFSATNVKQRRESTVDASFAEPLQIENMLVFLDAAEARLYEAAYTYEVEGYLARELSALNEHLFGVGVDQIAYQSHPHRIIWGRRLDGKLVAATYDRDQKVFGVTLVDYGDEVESIMSLPGNRKTDIWMTVKRVAPSGPGRHIELMAEFFRTGFGTQGVPVYGTGALIYSGAPISTVTGLAHLNGNEVGVWADGRDVGTFTIDGSTIQLENPASSIVVGRRIPGRIEGLRLENIGSREGTSMGRKMNILSARVDIYDSGPLKVGSLNEVHEMVFEDDSENDPYGPQPLRTGMFGLEVNDSWRNNGVFAIEVDSMYPATVRAVSLEVEGE